MQRGDVKTGLPRMPSAITTNPAITNPNKIRIMKLQLTAMVMKFVRFAGDVNYKRGQIPGRLYSGYDRAGASVTCDTMPTPGRQVLSIDSDWLFHLGDIDSPVANTHIAAYMANKAGWARGAKTNFDDSDLADGRPAARLVGRGQIRPVEPCQPGFLPRGVGWYRRHFRLDESDRGKYLAIQFDGVAMHCTVYVNGHLFTATSAATRRSPSTSPTSRHSATS